MALAEDIPLSLRARGPMVARARGQIQAWLADHGGHRTALGELLGELGERLRAADVPVARISCSLRDYHPEFIGRQYTWRFGRGGEQTDRRFQTVASDLFVQSPIRIISEGAEALRRRIAGPRAQRDFPMLEELAADGMTDYLALPLLFSDGSRQFISFASDHPDGFRPDQLSFIETLLPGLRQRIEIEHARQLADQVLETYLGAYAAPRVVSGEIRRVRGQAIEAIVLAVDMRGFTHLTDTHGADDVFRTLSAYYDAVAEPVLRAGGDIVKMIADGILAVFPIPEGSSDEARRDLARRAAGAVKAAAAALAAMAPGDLPQDVWPLRAGFALHAGEITFGNVGSRSRLDFTLIGPAVNEAFRIEAMTKELGRPILVSAAYAALIGPDHIVSLGFHALRGVREPKELFAFKSG